MRKRKKDASKGLNDVRPDSISLQQFSKHGPWTLPWGISDHFALSRIGQKAFIGESDVIKPHLLCLSKPPPPPLSSSSISSEEALLLDAMMLRKLLQNKLLLGRTNGRHIARLALRTYSGKDDSSKDIDKFEEWIPPNRPLAGDQGQSHLYVQQQEEEEEDSDEELQRIETELERLEKEEAAPSEDVFTEVSVDWLQTRRKVLGSEEQEEAGAALMTPKEGASRKQDMSDIPVKEHMLLSKDEIATCLEALGGTDISVILDNPKKRRMGGPIGMVIVTAYSNTQIRILADALVRQLRRRKLHEVGVVGAQLGPEGADDPDENWYVVDCRNYIVHIQGERIRDTIDLEGLWSGRDGLFNVNQLDEDEVDDWVAANPVPDDYSAPIFDWDSKLKKLEKSRYTSRHRPVIPRKKGKKAPRKRKG